MSSVQQNDARAYDLDGGALARDMATERVTTDPANMSATCVFSTGAVDRVGDVVEVGGIRTENHQRNPVVAWNHFKTLTLPIGKTVDPDGVYTVRLGDDIATQTTFFSQSLLEAEQIFRLIDEGIINANSIAFDNRRVQPIYAGGRKGLHVLECDLLEISWVGLPVNPEAVRKAIDALVCGRMLAEPIKRALEPYAARAAAWANGVTLKFYAGRAAVMKSAEFEESKHPRATDGRFGTKPGEHEGSGDEPAKLSQAEIDEVSRYLDNGVYTRQDAIDYFVDQDIPQAEAESIVSDLMAGETDDADAEPVRLSQGEIDEVANYLNNGNYTPEEATEYLVEQGLTQPAAEEMVRDLQYTDDEEDVDDNSEDDAAHDRAVDVSAALPDRRPDTIIAANVELRDEGDYVISLATGEPVHLDEYDADLSRNLEKILPQIKKRADLHALNAELETIDDQERIFYNGLAPEVIDNSIDNDSLAAINDYATQPNGNDMEAAVELNEQLAKDTDFKIVPRGKYQVKLVESGNDFADYFDDEGNAASLAVNIDNLPVEDRAGIAAKWNDLLDENGSTVRLLPDLEAGQFTAIDTAMLDEPDEVAQYIVDQYDISEARVEWFNDLMTEYGSGDRLMLTIDESGDLVVEVADGPDTAKGLRFWSTKSIVTS